MAPIHFAETRDKPSVERIDRRELDAAHARAAELLTLWQWRKALAYRVRLAQLKFQTDGLDPAEQKQLADDITSFSNAVAALADDTSWSAAA
jgi:hypothetical protein